MPGEQQPLAREFELKIHERPSERHGSFYLAGDRSCDAVAWVKLLVEKEGYIRGACLASCVTTTVLALSYIINFRRVIQQSATVTVLIFLPALLSYIIVRTSEHVVAKQFLSGLRKLVTVSSLLPVAGVVGIFLSKSEKHGQPSGLLTVLWITLIVISALISMTFIASSYLPKSVIRLPPLASWYRARRNQSGAGNDDPI